MAANGGCLKPHDFLKAAGAEDHAAHDYFDWEDTEAAHKHRLWQARQFVKFTIPVKVELEVEHDMTDGKGVITLRAPAVVSPATERACGGGYVSTATPEGRDILRDQALNSGYGLAAWLRRYESIMRADEVKAANALIRKLQR